MSASSTAAGLVDLAGLGALFVLSIALKGLVLVAFLGVDPKAIPLDDPRVYAVEYLSPLVLLPGLTWLLARRGGSWSRLGLRMPASWTRFVAWVVVVTLVALLLNRLVRQLPALWGGHWPPSPFEAIAGHPAAMVVAGIYTLLLVGLTEELVFRGFLMSRLALLLGETGGAWIAAAILTALVFGALHLQHGLLSALNATVLGLLFGFVYLGTGRNLWLVVAAHSLYDTAKAVHYFLSS